jgi:hypothetical protein
MLQEVGVTEVTYLALRRQGSRSLIPRRLKGQGEFTVAQLLALKSFALLRAHGLKIQVAAEAVAACFPAMEELASEGKLASESAYKVGVQIVAIRGRLGTAPLDVPAGDFITVGRIEVDLRGIAALLPRKQL